MGQTGKVLACSKECLPLFRCTLQDVDAGHIHINDWLPEFFKPRQAPQEDPEGADAGAERRSTASDPEAGAAATSTAAPTRGALSKLSRPVSRFMERVARNAHSVQNSESSENSASTKVRARARAGGGYNAAPRGR